MPLNQATPPSNALPRLLGHAHVLSAPAVVQTGHAHDKHSFKRSRGIRASDQYRTEDLVGEVRKHRVLWSREAREFHSTAARSMAYKRVADAMNAAFRTFDRGTAKKCVITGAC